MINIGIKTEFSFKQTFLKIDNILDNIDSKIAIGVADSNNTYSHFYLEKICKENNIKPIFGVRLMVVKNPEEKVRGRMGPEYLFIAKNNDGLKEIYSLVKTSYEKFYYKAMIGIDDMLRTSNNVFVISENPCTLDRLDYVGLSPSTPQMIANLDFPKLAIQNNRYPKAEDKGIYQLLAGARKSGTGYNYLFNDQTYPQHILSEEEHFFIFKDKSAIENTYIIAEQCNASIPKAPMVKYGGKKSLKYLCELGARKLNINIKEGIYKDRLERELSIISEKEYNDYFLIVSDMISTAKKKMLVGPARGSSGGSLVCYLTGITTIDPIKHGLLFERFIDLTRFDLPDIDADFPDEKRKYVIDNLMKQYDSENVCYIANINRLKAKSAIGELAQALSIPKWETDLVKEAIVDRSGGDARKAIAALDTLTTTEVGKNFVDKYPEMKNIKYIEGHVSHAGKHAAGIIVCNDPITLYGGVDREGSIMMDKRAAESKNLLKIDALGLRTLSIIESVCDQIGMDYKDVYKIPLDDKKTYTVFNEMRLNGIFQFEGAAMRMLCSKMGCENFNDIVALTALARPGPLHSGAANRYIKRRIGEDEIEYICSHPAYIKETEDTMGVIVYQEQLMNLCKNCGNMGWEDVSAIRKAASKTMGKDFFNNYMDKFLSGAKENEIDFDEAVDMWENMITFGSWGMNKSHSVAYGYVSYWTAYFKVHHPIEFAVANLNHTKGDVQALKLLRDAVENDNIEYIPVDPDESDVYWKAYDGKLLGGLTNIKGIAEKTAKDIIKKRQTGECPTNSIMLKLIHCKTPFDILYPTRHYFGDYYENFEKYGLINPPSFINDIDDSEQEYVVLGKVIKKEVRDLNEYNEVQKRNGVVWENNNKDFRIIIEDDTDQILCKITRYDFDKMNAASIYETLLEDKTYVIIRGEVRAGFRMMFIKAIYDLGVPEND